MGGPLEGELLATPGGLHLRGVPIANHPDRANEVVDALRDLSDTDLTRLAIGFTSRERWNHRSALTSWVRAAYLVGFALLGYSYILQPEFDVLRAGFAASASSLDRFPVAIEPAQPPDRRAAFVIAQPEWLYSLAVRMGRHTVFLPAAFPAPAFFDRLSGGLAARCQGLDGPWEVIQLGWPTQPEFRMDTDQV